MVPVINTEQFGQIFPRHREPEVWADTLNHTLFEFGVIDVPDVSMFLAQCGHESGEFTVFEENLNYSTDGLLRTFPRHFSDRAHAERFHRRPEAIANWVYRNRMGNGPESSGDGWKFRGRGPIQLTGRETYGRCSRSLYGDENVLLNDPDILLERRDGLLAALWFWETRNLKGNHDIRQVTRIINGGFNGIKHRTELYERALKVLRER